MDSLESRFQVRKAAGFDFYQLDPMPGQDELERFYQSQYYDLIRMGNRASEIKRLISGGTEAVLELDWIRKTLFSDILFMLQQHSPGKRVLDVGCGVGNLLRHLAEAGFNPMGLDPSADACRAAQECGLQAVSATLEEYLEMNGSAVGQYDAAVCINVLEHVPDPVGFTRTIRRLLKPDGLLIARVPNDFSEIQLAAHKYIQSRPWWIAIPDHVNYFNFESLRSMLEKLCFSVVYMQGDFPMEMFLLMGEVYVGDEVTGGRCHCMRRNFELNISETLRRKIYKGFAETGMSRTCFVAARAI